MGNELKIPIGRRRGEEEGEGAASGVERGADGHAEKTWPVSPQSKKNAPYLRDKILYRVYAAFLNVIFTFIYLCTGGSAPLFILSTIDTMNVWFILSTWMCGAAPLFMMDVYDELSTKIIAGFSFTNIHDIPPWY